MIGYYQVGNKRVIRLEDGNLFYPNDEQVGKIDFKKNGIERLGGQKKYLIYLQWLMVQYMKRMYNQSERTSYLVKNNKSNQKGGGMSLYGRNGLFGEVNGACGC